MNDAKFDSALNSTLKFVQGLLAKHGHVRLQDLWNTQDGGGSEHVRDAVRILLEQNQLTLQQDVHGELLTLVSSDYSQAA